MARNVSATKTKQNESFYSSMKSTADNRATMEMNRKRKEEKKKQSFFLQPSSPASLTSLDQSNWRDTKSRPGEDTEKVEKKIFTIRDNMQKEEK